MAALLPGVSTGTNQLLVSALVLTASLRDVPRRTCFEKMLITPVSTLDDWSNRADAISSISLRLALNSAFKSPVEPLRRAAKSLSAATLIWHCTICCPFLIVNPNAIKSASNPTSLPRVSGMNLAFSPMVRWSGPQVGPPAKRLVLLPTVTDPDAL